MPPKAKRGTMAPELPQPATKKRRGTATSAPPKAAMSVPGNAVDQTPGAGSSIIRPTKPLPRKKSSANPWAESDPPSPPKAPRPSTSTLPSSSTASAVPRRSERKRGNPDTSAISVASPSPAKRPRTSKARAPPPVVATIRASDGSSSDSDEDEEVVVDDASGPPDLTKMTPEEYAEMCSGWEKSVQDCQQRVLAISVQDERLAQDLENAVIGSAFLQFIGVGDVKGVVDLEGDPNKRGNPRGLNSGHVGILHDITRRPNAKKDHESPIFAQVDANLIEEELRDKMRAADARNLLSKVPMLVLKRKHAEREAKLEEEILLQRSEGRWLSPAEVDARQAELDGYRADPEYPKAQILNGNHRTHAMLLGNTAIFEKRDLVRSMIEKNTSSKEDVEREMAEFKKMVEAHTWRCLVYDTNKLTKSAQNFLVHNSHERPVMGMNTSEKCWWLAQTWETAFDELQGPTQGHDRASAGNIISKRWRKEIGQKMTGKQGAESAEHAPETSHSKVLGDLAGTDAASRLFYDAVSMEMVLDCRSALWAFGLLIDKPVAISMLRPSGGPLVTHVWLALRTLLTLCNVQAGDGLTDAENWIRQNEALTADGYDDALPHFQSLHNRPERVPQLLSKYGEKEAIEFGSMYQADVEPLAI
ncbi:hypothetical protein FRC09_006543, partial [Ceratobasidium sp. 395]